MLKLTKTLGLLIFFGCSFYVNITYAMMLSSPAFSSDGAIPHLYTCDGPNEPPQLNWKNASPKTQSFALIVSDPDAPDGTYYHWVLVNIPKSVDNLPPSNAKLPQGITIGKNSFGKQEYDGPCPPKQSSHTYVFTLYALDGTIPLPISDKPADVVHALEPHVIDKVELKGIYGRW